MTRCLTCAAIWFTFCVLTIYCIVVDQPTGFPPFDLYARLIGFCYWIFGIVLAFYRLTRMFTEIEMMNPRIDGRHIHQPTVEDGQ